MFEQRMLAELVGGPDNAARMFIGEAAPEVLPMPSGAYYLRREWSGDEHRWLYVHDPQPRPRKGNR